ncbi:MAG: DUF5752 family protein, partial [Candidatus Eremiobacterota bacterium]
ENRDADLQLVDGVRIARDDEGWVLVIPDPTQPQLRLWAEADGEEETQALLTHYRSILERLLEREETSAESGERAAYRELAPAEPVLDTSLLPEERAFHFWTPGRYLGVRARSYREFVDTLHYIEPASIAYHLERGDFSNWVEYELKDAGLAERIRILDAAASGEDLRSELLRLFPYAESRA